MWWYSHLNSAGLHRTTLKAVVRSRLYWISKSEASNKSIARLIDTKSRDPYFQKKRYKLQKEQEVLKVYVRIF